MLLSDAQTAEFARTGYLFFPRLFTPEETAPLLQQVPRELAHEGPEVVRERGGESVRTVFAAHRRNDLFARLARHPRLICAAERLLGGPVYLHQFKINVKSAFDGDLWQWHQDFGTWHREDGMPEARAMNLLVFLEDVNEFNGPLMLIPGSHVHGNLSAKWDAQTTSYPLWALDRPTIARLVDQGGIVAPKGPAGSVLLIHSNVVHASTCNLSPWRRTSVILSVSRTDNPIAVYKRPEWIAHRDFAAIEVLADDCLNPEFPSRRCL
ncbi:MAG: phytanoyl-CoA dioxygenase family protein [Myxococcales bacterium]|nr:phytanoyl-CoA dioxygenase family protein [Myxococcales bacterium]